MCAIFEISVHEVQIHCIFKHFKEIFHSFSKIIFKVQCILKGENLMYREEKHQFTAIYY